MRPVLVGESPGPYDDPDMRMYPRRPRSVGNQLVAISGLLAAEYLAQFTRVHLLYEHPGTRWPSARASAAASHLQPLLAERTVVLVGARVACAFGLEELPLYAWTNAHGGLFGRIPYPSSRRDEYVAERDASPIRAFLHDALARSEKRTEQK